MKIKLPLLSHQTNRRSFLKSQLTIGVAAFTTGMVIPQACSSPGKPAGLSDSSTEALRKYYQDCLGGPFPEPCPLLIDTKEIILALEGKGFTVDVTQSLKETANKNNSDPHTLFEIIYGVVHEK